MRNRKRRGFRIRLPGVPIRKAWDWIRERAAGGWSRHRASSLRIGRHLAIIGGFGLVVLLIHHELISVVRDQDRYAIDPGAGDIAVQPDWADDTGADPPPGSVGGDISSTLDDELVQEIGRALDSNPWIRRVISVERVYPDKVRVRFEYREPHLAVQTSRGYVLVDRDLVRLPGRYPRIPVELDRPEIAGVPGEPPAAGKSWSDIPLRGGLELADLVGVHPTLKALDVRRVDVSDPEGRAVLVTGNGCLVYWGRPPCRAAWGELSVEEKMRNLRRVLQKHPGLEGLGAVLVYGERPTYSRRDGRAARGR